MTTEAKWIPSPMVHDQYDAIVMSLSAIMYMASHPYHYWGTCIELSNLQMPDTPGRDDADRRAMFMESGQRCERQMRRVCELLDEVMNYIGDCNNAHDAVDDYGMTDAAFAAMNRALGRKTGGQEEVVDHAP